MTLPAVGDYVLATKWTDGYPRDPWCVGFLIKVEGDRFVISDSNGDIISRNGCRRCQKISKSKGEFLISNMTDVELSGKSVWWWLRQPLNN